MAEIYTIRWTEEAAADVAALRKFDQRRVMNAVQVHLSHEPARVSRSRIKLMEQPFWSQYRLRVDDFRVYYDMDETAHAVMVLRVLEKGTLQTPEQP